MHVVKGYVMRDWMELAGLLALLLGWGTLALYALFNVTAKGRQ